MTILSSFAILCYFLKTLENLSLKFHTHIHKWICYNVDGSKDSLHLPQLLCSSIWRAIISLRTSHECRRVFQEHSWLLKSSSQWLIVSNVHFYDERLLLMRRMEKETKDILNGMGKEKKMCNMRSCALIFLIV